MRSQEECRSLSLVLFLNLGDESISEEFHGSFWSSCECFLPFDEHREYECHISVIDFHRYAFERDGLDESDEVFEKFLIDSDDEIDSAYPRLLGEFVELHSTLVKERIIVRIPDFKFNRFSRIIDGFELIDAFWRRTIPC